MILNVKISRSSPKSGKPTELVPYTIEVEKGARVLNVLEVISNSIDPTLTFRKSCQTGQCGSCSVKVNGEPCLACITEATDGMIVEPLDLPVIKDLKVDLVAGINKIPRISSCKCIIPSDDTIAAIKPFRNCIECLSCVSVCPAIKVADFLGPTGMRGNMRIALDPRANNFDIEKVIKEGLFTCTSCNRCLRVCPKSIETPGKAIEKLREIANRNGLTLPAHKSVEEQVKKTGRSVPDKGDTFLSQVDEVIEPYGEVKGEVGFFVGCMLNARVTKPAFDLIDIMKKSGIRLIIPHDQVCCGSPLIRTGQTTIVPSLKERNIHAFERLGIKTVMTMCAGCGATLKNDYRDCNASFVVKDVTEIICEYGLPKQSKLSGTATYHDPCHLKNGQQITKEPRALLKSIVENFVEMPSQCCGSGGGVRSGLPDEAAALGELRREEIERTGADMVVTICPFCEFHISEHTDKPVCNLISLIAKSLQ